MTIETRGTHHTERRHTMKSFFDRTASEQEIIRLAYDFEIEAIEQTSSARNPYLEAVKEMGLLEALNEAVELHYEAC